MFRFLTKVFIAGEINDFRKQRKVKRREKRLAKREDRRKRVVELGIIEEKIKGNEFMKEKYRKITNRFVKSVLVLALSFVLGFVLIPSFLVTVLSMPVALYYAIRVVCVKKQILNN